MSFIQSLPISFSLDGAFATLVAAPNCVPAPFTITRVYGSSSGLTQLQSFVGVVAASCAVIAST